MRTGCQWFPNYQYAFAEPGPATSHLTVTDSGCFGGGLRGPNPGWQPLQQVKVKVLGFHSQYRHRSGVSVEYYYHECLPFVAQALVLSGTD